MYYAVTLPIVVLLSIGFGFLMAKQFESIGTGKVLAAFGFCFLVMLVLLIKFIINL
ncbi:hypothetical protein HQ524_00665 [Candidatus Uhrbacteria bacterium]|nr:hypothetical protein [Candidatus Uhrbacteria bacterium]